MVLRCSKGLRPTSIARTLVSLADATAICNLGPRALPQHRGSGARSISSGWEPRCFHKEDSPGFAKFDRKRSNKKTPSSCLRNESRKHPRTPPPTRIQQSQETARRKRAAHCEPKVTSSALPRHKERQTCILKYVYMYVCIYICIYYMTCDVRLEVQIDVKC